MSVKKAGSVWVKSSRKYQASLQWWIWVTRGWGRASAQQPSARTCPPPHAKPGTATPCLIATPTVWPRICPNPFCSGIRNGGATPLPVSILAGKGTRKHKFTFYLHPKKPQHSYIETLLCFLLWLCLWLLTPCPAAPQLLPERLGRVFQWRGWAGAKCCTLQPGPGHSPVF